MAGFSSDTVYANNVDFSGSTHPTPQVTTDGQLLIGSTVAPNIRVGTLTAGTGVSITNAAGSITIGLSGSGVAVEHLTGNTGGVLNPDGANNFTIIGTGALSVAGVGSTLTISSSAPTTDLHTARFIVSAGGSSDGANYTTIASAITAASSGATIFIQPGTYTENLTLKAGVNLTAFTCDGSSSSSSNTNVIIVGKMTATYTGIVSISGVELKTNSDYVIESTGSNTATLFVKDCHLNLTNGSGIHSTNANFNCLITECTGDLGTTLISYFVYTGGVITFTKCSLTNSGSSVTAATAADSQVGFSYTQTMNPITTSGSTTFTAQWSQWATGNTTSLTMGGSGGSLLEFCVLAAGSASAISASNTTTLYDCVVGSSNTNAITGAGTVNYSGIVFSSSSSLINASTQGQSYVNLGKYKATGQPAFLAYLSAAGTGAAAGTIPFDTVVYDTGSNFTTGVGAKFTAPVTGKYLISTGVTVNSGATGQGIFIEIVATSRSLLFTGVQPASAIQSQTGISGSAVIDMTAGDTATILTGFFSANQTTIGTNSPYSTFVSGHLVC